MDELKDLTFWQRMEFVLFWNSRRRMKYFDFLRDGKSVKFAFKDAKNFKNP